MDGGAGLSSPFSAVFLQALWLTAGRGLSSKQKTSSMVSPKTFARA